MSSKVLVLDTSLQGLTLALVELSGSSFDILEQYDSHLPQEAAARLPELCQSLLQKQKWNVKDLDILLVSHGPGSFTGIKIGLSFAAGWKRAGNRTKVYGVSSVKGLQGLKPKGHSLLIPATQTAGYFAQNGEDKVELGVIDLLSTYKIAKVDDAMESHVNVSATSLGQAEILGQWPKIEAWLTEQNVAWTKASPDNNQPDFHSSVVKGMVQEFIANSDKLSEGKLVPVYLRKSAPEEKLEQAQAKHD